MNRVQLFAIATLISAGFGSLSAQESIRRADGPGEFTKHLTPGQLDTWIINGSEGETITAHVQTGEFDPVLELVQKDGDDNEKTLLAVDDAGSESRFSLRLPADGEYHIRIHGFKFQGGGNYILRIRRFIASAVDPGKPAEGVFDKEGKAYHFFPCAADSIWIPEVKGTSPDQWEFLDTKGTTVRKWAETVRAEQKGEHSLILSGQPGHRYSLEIRAANRRELAEKQESKLGRNAMDVWEFETAAGDFRILEVKTTGELAARLISAPGNKSDASPGVSLNKKSSHVFLPLNSKGNTHRFAIAASDVAPFELQLLASTDNQYELTFRDPAVALKTVELAEGALPVGGYAFYRFEAKIGQLLEASLTADGFDTCLKLYDAEGMAIAENDDGGEGLNSQITQIILKTGVYLLQVGSQGDGGGGKFQLELSEREVKTLKPGGKAEGELKLSGKDVWNFTGEEGQTLILSAQSKSCDTVVTVFSSEGVELAKDDNGGSGTDSLLAITLPKKGRYTVTVTSRRGEGSYSVQLFDSGK